MDYYNLNSQSGLAAIVSVVIISAAVLIIVGNMSLAGFRGLEFADAADKGAQALTAGESCLEEALRRLRLDAGYEADGLVLALAGNDCVLTITGTSSQRSIEAVGQAGVYYKNVKADITISESGILIENWREEY